MVETLIRRRGRPAQVTLEDGVFSVVVNGTQYMFKDNTRLTPTGDAAILTNTEDYAYARARVKGAV